jgi:hypothetical protein
MKCSPKKPTTNFSIQLIWGPLALQGLTCTTGWCGNGQVVPHISKDHSAFIFRVKQTKASWTAWCQRRRHYDPSKYGDLHPVTRCHIPEDLNLNQPFSVTMSVCTHAAFWEWLNRWWGRFKFGSSTKGHIPLCLKLDDSIRHSMYSSLYL